MILLTGASGFLGKEVLSKKLKNVSATSLRRSKFFHSLNILEIEIVLNYRDNQNKVSN